MMLVSDVMSRNLYSIESDASAEEAAWALTRRTISGAPVKDASGAVVGVLSKTDLCDPSARDWLRKSEATAEDLMTPAVYEIASDAPARAAAQMMADHRVHRLLVRDMEGEIVGIVTALDLVTAIARGTCFSQPEGENVRRRS
jgi:predicted transcriptional regulator